MLNVESVETGVPGLDAVLNGGIPRGASVLVVGPSGAGKTVLATQIVFHHARRGRRALVLTALTEASSKLIAHLGGLAYFDPALLGEQVRIFNVELALPQEGLDPTLAEILRTVVHDRIEFLLVESVGSLYALLEDRAAVQSFLFRLGSALFQVGCTTLLVSDERALDPRTTLEAAISDVTLQLGVALVGKRELRELRAIKVRGAAPLTGLHAFEITGAGVRVYPRVEAQAVAAEIPDAPGRLGWGVPGLDALTGGGIPRADSTLVIGTTGIGKTTLALHVVAEGLARGERCLYLTFHETARRLLQKAAGFGLDLGAAAAAGQLAITHVAPADIDVDRVLGRLLEEVGPGGVGRLVIDSLNPLERNATREGRFPEIVPALLHLLQARGVTTVITREMTRVVGPSLDLADGGAAYWTPIDNIALLRPVELSGAVGRVLSVLKMRRSAHSAAFHAFGIGPTGLELGEQLQGLQGLFTGLPRRSE